VNAASGSNSESTRKDKKWLTKKEKTQLHISLMKLATDVHIVEREIKEEQEDLV
jgi:hypothetical protein